MNNVGQLVVGNTEFSSFLYCTYKTLLDDYSPCIVMYFLSLIDCIKIFILLIDCIKIFIL